MKLLNRLYNQLVKEVNAIQTNDTSYLVKKADYDTKIKEIQYKVPDHDKYITTQKFNWLTAENFSGRLKQAKFAIFDFVKKTYFDEKLININKKVISGEKILNELSKMLNYHQPKAIIFC